MSYLLEFEAVDYTYPLAETAALKNLSLRLPEGKKSALVGQNGCGKSTLFLLADGLVRPDRGVIKFRSQPLIYDSASLNQWRQKIGLVFQNPEQQLVAPTVAADVSYGLCNQELSPAEIARRVEQNLQDFQLQTLAQRPIHHLSLGQKKRVSLAGVMVLQPELLLLDEPTAYLDPLQTRNFLAELETIAEGTTLLVATHDLDFVYQWADWVFVLHAGCLVLEGEPIEVFDRLQRQPDFQLGAPLLWQLWQSLPTALKPLSAPRTLADLIACLSAHSKF